MAEKVMDANEAALKDVSPKTISTSAGARWFEFTDGGVWRLTLNVDAYYLTVSKAIEGAAAWAKRYGYRLDVRGRTATTLDVRFVLRESRPKRGTKAEEPKRRVSVNDPSKRKPNPAKMIFDPATGTLLPQRTWTVVMTETHDRKPHTVRGSDFGVSIEKLRARVTTYARYHGLKYRTRKLADDVLEIRLIVDAETKWSK